MSRTTFSPEMMSNLEADNIENFKTLLDHQSSPISGLDELLAHAIEHLAFHCIDHLLSLGANPLSDTAFQELLASSSFAAFQHLIEKGAININQDLDWLGTFLILAIKRNKLEHVNFCLEHGANPNLGMYARVWTALATAAEYGASVQVVERILRSGVDTNSSDALQTSARKNRVDLMKVLLDNGADIDGIGFEYCVTDWLADEAGSALHFAVDGDSVEAVELLLMKGANTDLKDAKGRTAVERAIDKGNDAAARVLRAVSITAS